MSEITEEEKAQARRDAGILDDEYLDPGLNGAPEYDPIEELKQRYLAGEIDDATLNQEIRRIATQRAGSIFPTASPYPTINWQRLLGAMVTALTVGLAVGIESGFQAYANYREPPGGES